MQIPELELTINEESTCVLYSHNTDYCDSHPVSLEEFKYLRLLNVIQLCCLGFSRGEKVLLSV
jgi:hypothetical protein